VSLNIDPTQVVPVRPAATVMLVRDRDRASGGIEVCMLQRNLNSDFVGGAYVFPGGGVDPDDGEPDVGKICLGLTDIEASAQLGLPSNGLAFWVAAVRETLEEAGLLMAVRGDGGPIDFSDPAVVARFAEHRRMVDHRERRLVEICAEEDVRLSLEAMYYVGRWITPPGSPRRYDTRFFLAAAPDGQRAVQDDREVISAQWIAPDEALARHDRSEFAMLPPTVANLRMLREYDSTVAALEGAATFGPVHTVAPRILSDANGIRIVMPGDPAYDDAYAGDNSLSSWPGTEDRSGADWEQGVPVGTVHIGMGDGDVTARTPSS
jgi:8-oxo-dGTP pyrophosphatase MutT (NUDIX family)